MDDARASAVEFDRFLLEIMDRTAEIRLASVPRTPFDLQAWRHGEALHVFTEIPTPQTPARLRSLAKELDKWINLTESFDVGFRPAFVLAVPGLLLSSRIKDGDAIWSRFEVWDGPRLHRWATELGVPIPPFVISGEPENSAGGEQNALSSTTIEHALLRRLAQIAYGQPAWREYEKFCEDLLNFLFVPP
jgi:hypothetical protein